ncbi:MAG: glycosyltransferase family 4 protein [Flavobacteriales bacterium]|nr:glycosyltransferase family 4 protein [Flavobacteriales bacterium]
MMPRVIHLSTARTWRGGEQQVAYLVEELHTMGAAQLVVCASGSPMESFCNKIGMAHRTLGFRASFDPLNARRLAGIARTWRADLLHTHDSHGHTAAILANTLFGMHLPLVVSRRVDFPISSSFSARWKYGHSSVKRILCVSDAINAMTAPALKRPGVLRTVHSGIDPARFAAGADGRLRTALHLDPGVPLVGNVAALAPHKDLFTFIRMAAVVHAQAPGVRFVLIGEGELRARLEAAAQQAGLGAVLQFTGFRKDVDRLLPELDVMAMTSRTEGLGTSILDAFAARVPVVATAAGGIPELITDGETGLLRPVGDDAALAQAVIAVLHDRALRDRLVQGATAKLQGFTRQATARATLHEYHSVLAELRGAANTNSA